MIFFKFMDDPIGDSLELHSWRVREESPRYIILTREADQYDVDAYWEDVDENPHMSYYPAYEVGSVQYTIVIEDWEDVLSDELAQSSLIALLVEATFSSNEEVWSWVGGTFIREASRRVRARRRKEAREIVGPHEALLRKL